jgi:AcrR family transcriptional regulator
VGSNPEQVRQRILAHATARFLAGGFRRITMEQIARELGLSKKTIYGHFPGKQELLSAAVRNQLDGLKARLEEVFGARDLPFPTRLDRLLQVVGAQLSAIGQPMVEDLYRHAPQVWREIDEFRKAVVFSRLESLLRQGAREGYVRRDLEPRLITMVIVQIAQAALNPAQFVGLGASPAEGLAAVMSLLYRGVFTERGRADVEALAARAPRGKGRKRHA